MSDNIYLETHTKITLLKFIFVIAEDIIAKLVHALLYAFKYYEPFDLLHAAVFSCYCIVNIYQNPCWTHVYCSCRNIDFFASYRITSL